MTKCAPFITSGRYWHLAFILILNLSAVSMARASAHCEQFEQQQECPVEWSGSKRATSFGNIGPTRCRQVCNRIGDGAAFYTLGKQQDAWCFICKKANAENRAPASIWRSSDKER